MRVLYFWAPLGELRIPREGCIPEAECVVLRSTWKELRNGKQFRARCRPSKNFNICFRPQECKEVSFVFFRKRNGSLATHSDPSYW